MPRCGKSTKATFLVYFPSPVECNSNLGHSKRIIAVYAIFERKTHQHIVGFRLRSISPIRHNPWRGYKKRVRMAVTRSRKAAAIQKTPSRPKRPLRPPKKSRKGRKDKSPLDTTSNVRNRAEHPEDYPDLDFHHSFGSFLTRKNPISSTVNAEIARYWGLLSETPSLLQHHTHRIGEKYRGAFRQFFTADPISLHGHVSDASNVALLTSLISHLVSHASKDHGTSSSSEEDASEDHSEEDASEGHKISFFSEDDKSNPRVAILEGSYGAGYGCLAYDAIIRTVRPLANGPRPFIIETNIARRIDTQVERAKNEGCVALIAEIVRAEDGKPISERVWGSLLAACDKHALILIVDEALTAIRCGAPFAYQLPQYSTHGFPDLVLFGKAVRTNGIAVEWRGINIQKLRIENRPFAILDWQERLTEMAQIADLLISWGTLVLARKERWPQRAQQIGTLLRNILVAEGVRRAEIGGLHSLIYIQPSDVKRLSSPVMGAKAEEHIRWLPVLDEVMASEDELRAKVFGQTSIPHREQVSAFLRRQRLKLRFCGGCGDAVEEGVRSCERCVVRFCKKCEKKKHVCRMRD